jgi:hypothetical protein
LLSFGFNFCFSQQGVQPFVGVGMIANQNFMQLVSRLSEKPQPKDLNYCPLQQKQQEITMMLLVSAPATSGNDFALTLL